MKRDLLRLADLSTQEIEAILALAKRLKDELRDGTPHPLLGHGSLHASLISGGQELSSYPETCTVEIERRTLPHENRVLKQATNGVDVPVELARKD